MPQKNESDERRRYRQALDLAAELRAFNRPPTKEEREQLSALTSDHSFGNVEMTLFVAMSHLRCARDQAAECGAHKTAERIRSAIRSCGGAIRHASAKKLRSEPPA